MHKHLQISVSMKTFTNSMYIFMLKIYLHTNTHHVGRDAVLSIVSHMQPFENFRYFLTNDRCVLYSDDK